ncbi:hypothetical protein COBT_001901 [Conglomerata obtusa]
MMIFVFFSLFFCSDAGVKGDERGKKGRVKRRRFLCCGQVSSSDDIYNSKTNEQNDVGTLRDAKKAVIEQKKDDVTTNPNAEKKTMRSSQLSLYDNVPVKDMKNNYQENRIDLNSSAETVKHFTTQEVSHIQAANDVNNVITSAMDLNHADNTSKEKLYPTLRINEDAIKNSD